MAELGQRIHAAGASIRETFAALPQVRVPRSIEEVIYVLADQYHPVPVGRIDGITATVYPSFESDLSHGGEIPVVLEGNEIAVSAYAFRHFDIPKGNIMLI